MSVTAERIQEILGLEMRVARDAGNFRGLRPLKDLAKRIARADVRGLFTVDGSVLETATRVVRFTDQERKAYEDSGASIHLPIGETIRDMRRSRQMWVTAEGYNGDDGKNRLLDFSARRIEVAVWIDPKDPESFFVPDSFSKNTDQQDRLRLKDAKDLEKRLGIPVNLIRPEASEVLNIMFQHVDKTGVRLLGEDWIKDDYWRYIRTSTPTTKSGSGLAVAGEFDSDRGPLVDDWVRDKSLVNLGDARWAVPNGAR